MTTDTEIERYLNSLPEGILTLDISGKGITSLPDLTRFTNLKKLNCSRNNLTSLPNLPPNLTELNCYGNQLNLLPTLPPKLEVLTCYMNKLTSLPTLPQNLTLLYCYENNLTSLPNLPPNLKTFYGYYNPIDEIVMGDYLDQIKKNIQELNDRRHLDYCLKFKTQLRKWLWKKVRYTNEKKVCNPNYLFKNLGEEDDLDAFLDNWKIINKQHF